jgi:ABC-type multidrug transport system ATPase subunit
MTVLLATHMIDFAEHLSDDVTVLRAGHVAYTGSALAFGHGQGTLESRVLPLIETAGPG